MARSKRRPARSSAQQKVTEPTPNTPASTRSSLTPVQDEEPSAPPATAEIVQGVSTSEDTCPDCKDDPLGNTDAKESWIRCDACKTWYHWVCAGNGGDPDTIDKWQVSRRASGLSVVEREHDV